MARACRGRRRWWWGWCQWMWWICPTDEPSTNERSTNERSTNERSTNEPSWWMWRICPTNERPAGQQICTILRVDHDCTIIVPSCTEFFLYNVLEILSVVPSDRIG